MDKVTDWLDVALKQIPWISAIVGGFLVLVLVKRLLDYKAARTGKEHFRNPVVLLVLSFFYLILIIVALPLGDTIRGQLLSLLGILMSAAIALSSTTFLGNVMAGLMLRGVRSFRAGEFIRVGEHFGRVSGLGLLSTEIQTEERDLITLPNLFLVTNPIRVIRPSGTIVSTTVSLGYDVPREKIKELLLEAVKETGLSDGFVQVMELGDFSVTYRAAGLLSDVKNILSWQARLRALVMDCLHRGKVEIVSPEFKNVRNLTKNQKFIAKVAAETACDMEDDSVPEEVVFDKAEKAEAIQKIKIEQDELAKKIAEDKKALKKIKDQTEKEIVKSQLTDLEKEKESIQRLLKIKEQEEAEEEEKDKEIK
jgi:small conductance mechanosensitive channel